MAKPYAITCLEPYFPTIVSIIREAADTVESFAIPPETRVVLDRGATGIARYLLIMDLLRKRFGCDGPIHVVDDDGLKLLFFEELGLYVRFNALDARTFAGPVSRTPQRLQYRQHLLFEDAAETPGYLVFGYTTRLDDRGAMVVDRVLLTLEGEDGVIWSEFIDRPTVQQSSITMNRPTKTPPAVRPTASKGVKPNVNGA